MFFLNFIARKKKLVKKMTQYKITIKFITDYLQAQYSDKAKLETVQQTSNGIQDVDNTDMRLMLYEDSKGIYIPAVQLQKCFEASAKATKWKKTKTNWLKWAIAYLTVNPSKIYLGKKDPDDTLTSYPKRRDGSRVKVIHPVFNAGLQIEFQANVSDPDRQYTNDDMESLIKKGGQMFGIGGRRADKFGRFEVVEFLKL